MAGLIAKLVLANESSLQLWGDRVIIPVVHIDLIRYGRATRHALQDLVCWSEQD